MAIFKLISTVSNGVYLVRPKWNSKLDWTFVHTHDLYGSSYVIHWYAESYTWKLALFFTSYNEYYGLFFTNSGSGLFRILFYNIGSSDNIVIIVILK